MSDVEVNSNLVWCDDVKSNFYNRLVNLKNLKIIKFSYEKLYRLDNAYDIFIEINHNQAPIIRSKGSAIFIHCSFDDLRSTLLKVFGIGPWSINMFEIFCLGKLDIFTSKDAGLRLAMNKAGIINLESNWDTYDNYAAKWSPFRTIASLHLWKFVD